MFGQEDIADFEVTQRRVPMADLTTEEDEYGASLTVAVEVRRHGRVTDELAKDFASQERPSKGKFLGKRLRYNSRGQLTPSLTRKRRSHSGSSSRYTYSPAHCMNASPAS